MAENDFNRDMDSSAADDDLFKDLDSEESKNQYVLAAESIAQASATSGSASEVSFSGQKSSQTVLPDATKKQYQTRLKTNQDFKTELLSLKKQGQHVKDHHDQFKLDHQLTNTLLKHYYSDKQPSNRDINQMTQAINREGSDIVITNCLNQVNAESKSLKADLTGDHSKLTPHDSELADYRPEIPKQLYRDEVKSSEANSQSTSLTSKSSSANLGSKVGSFIKRGVAAVSSEYQTQSKQVKAQINHYRFKQQLEQEQQRMQKHPTYLAKDHELFDKQTKLDDYGMNLNDAKDLNDHAKSRQDKTDAKLYLATLISGKKYGDDYKPAQVKSVYQDITKNGFEKTITSEINHTQHDADVIGLRRNALATYMSLPDANSDDKSLADQAMKPNFRITSTKARSQAAKLGFNSSLVDSLGGNAKSINTSYTNSVLGSDATKNPSSAASEATSSQAEDSNSSTASKASKARHESLEASLDSTSSASYQNDDSNNSTASKASKARHEAQEASDNDASSSAAPASGDPEAKLPKQQRVNSKDVKASKPQPDFANATKTQTADKGGHKAMDKHLEAKASADKKTIVDDNINQRAAHTAADIHQHIDDQALAAENAKLEAQLNKRKAHDQLVDRNNELRSSLGLPKRRRSFIKELTEAWKRSQRPYEKQTAGSLFIQHAQRGGKSAIRVSKGIAYGAFKVVSASMRGAKHLAQKASKHFMHSLDKGVLQGFAPSTANAASSDLQR